MALKVVSPRIFISREGEIFLQSLLNSVWATLIRTLNALARSIAFGGGVALDAQSVANGMWHETYALRSTGECGIPVASSLLDGRRFDIIF